MLLVGQTWNGLAGDPAFVRVAVVTPHPVLRFEPSIGEVGPDCVEVVRVTMPHSCQRSAAGFVLIADTPPLWSGGAGKLQPITTMAVVSMTATARMRA